MNANSCADAPATPCQAAATGARLRARLAALECEPPREIVHSTLARAAETALLLRDAGFPGAALVPDAALREGAPAVPSPKCVTSRSTR